MKHKLLPIIGAITICMSVTICAQQSKVNNSSRRTVNYRYRSSDNITVSPAPTGNHAATSEPSNHTESSGIPKDWIRDQSTATAVPFANNISNSDTFELEGRLYRLMIPYDLRSLVNTETDEAVSNYDKIFVDLMGKNDSINEPDEFKQVNFIAGDQEYELFTVYIYNTSQFEQQVLNEGVYEFKILDKNADYTSFLTIPKSSPIRDEAAYSDDYKYVLERLGDITFVTNISATASPVPATPSPTASPQPEDTALHLTYDKIKFYGVTKYIPVRDVLEKLDYSVSWIPSTKTIEIRKGDVYETLRTGKRSFINAETGNFIEDNVIIEDAKSYVPLSYFENVLNINVSDITNDSISFR